jgi:hypothetical protein
MNSEDIDDLYSRMIELNLQCNQKLYTKIINHDRSVFSKVNTNFVELEKQPNPMVLDQAINGASTRTSKYHSKVNPEHVNS